MDVAPALAKEELPLKSAVVKVVDVATENGVISAGAPDVSEDVSNPEFDTEDGDSGASGDSEDSDDNWETESLYEDSLQFVRDDQLHDGKGNSFSFSLSFFLEFFLSFCFLGPNAPLTGVLFPGNQSTD